MIFLPNKGNFIEKYMWTCLVVVSNSRNCNKMFKLWNFHFPGDSMNQILNDNWDEVLKELKPSFEEALSEIFREITNRLFSKVPLEEIYPEHAETKDHWYEGSKDERWWFPRKVPTYSKYSKFSKFVLVTEVPR